MSETNDSKGLASGERGRLLPRDDELGDFMPISSRTARIDGGPERRTLIRRAADRAQAGVLRGEVSPMAGEVFESLPVDPNCRYCGGRGMVVGGDIPRVCWCRQGKLPY